MSVDPNDVTSPKNRWKLDTVLYNKNGWSAATGSWEDNGRWDEVLALRWNGEPSHDKGQPQSRGYPTWFIVPDEIAGVLREVIALLPKP